MESFKGKVTEIINRLVIKYGYSTDEAIKDILEAHKLALRQLPVSRRSEQLFCDCEIKGSSFQLATGEIYCCKCEKERAK